MCMCIDFDRTINRGQVTQSKHAVSALTSEAFSISFLYTYYCWPHNFLLRGAVFCARPRVFGENDFESSSGAFTRDRLHDINQKTYYIPVYMCL